jgi:phage terminase small subunit
LRDETLKQEIESPSKDLETLKHILEALQLKGLLHSKKPTNQTNQINFVYEETPVVLMKPASMNRPDERLEDWKRRRQNRRGQYSGWLES